MIEYLLALLVLAFVGIYAICADFEHYAITSVGVYRRIKRYDVESDRLCIECGVAVGDGEKRKASKEIVLFGWPIYETEAVANYYCEDHASFEYLQGEAVTPTEDRLLVALGTLGGVFEPVETETDPRFEQVVQSGNAAFQLALVAFLIIIMAAVISVIQPSRGKS